MASFEGIKVGDEVIICPPGYSHIRSLAAVEAVTRTRFVVGGYRFRKKDGYHITKDRWHHAYVYQPTPELLAEVESECRYTKAHESLIKLRHQLETLTREIDRSHDKHQLSKTMEAAAADLAAAVAKLQEVVK